MMPQWFPVALLLGFLNLDVLAIGQFMISRPIVVGPLVGFVTGHPDLGLEMGALIELIWIGDLPVGAHLPMDFTVLTGIAVALASELMKGMYPMEAAITYSIGIAIPLALLAIEAEVLIRKFHVHWIHFAQKMVLTSHLRTFEWVNILVLFEIFLKGFLAAAVGLAVAHLASSLFFILPAKVIEGLYYGHWLLLALGCSAVIDLLMEKKTVLYLVLSIAAIMILAMLFQNQGAILVSLVLFAGFLVTLFYVGRGEVS